MSLFIDLKDVLHITGKLKPDNVNCINLPEE